MILSSQTIDWRCAKEELISPFNYKTQFTGVSHGLSFAGYDVRVEFDKDGATDGVLIRPGAFLLASTIEYFKMPNDLVGIVHDKSTWARRGIALQNTVIEPNWEGYLTLEITNHGNNPVRIERGMGIAQIIFHRLDEPVKIGYSGKYQKQERGPVEAREG